MPWYGWAGIVCAAGGYIWYILFMSSGRDSECERNNDIDNWWDMRF